jgi:hypothetical protein
MSNMVVGINQRWSIALKVPGHGQFLVKTGQSLVESPLHKNANFSGTAGQEVVIFNQNLQGTN